MADRLGLTPDLAAGLTRRQADGRGRPATTPRRVRRSPGRTTSACSWRMCLALPDRGRILLDDLDVAHFGDASHWEAATHIRRDAGG